MKNFYGRAGFITSLVLFQLNFAHANTDKSCTSLVNNYLKKMNFKGTIDQPTDFTKRHTQKKSDEVLDQFQKDFNDLYANFPEKSPVNTGSAPEVYASRRYDDARIAWSEKLKKMVGEFSNKVGADLSIEMPAYDLYTKRDARGLMDLVKHAKDKSPPFGEGGRFAEYGDALYSNVPLFLHLIGSTGYDDVVDVSAGNQKVRFFYRNGALVGIGEYGIDPDGYSYEARAISIADCVPRAVETEDNPLDLGGYFSSPDVSAVCRAVPRIEAAAKALNEYQPIDSLSAQCGALGGELRSPRVKTLFGSRPYEKGGNLVCYDSKTGESDLDCSGSSVICVCPPDLKKRVDFSPIQVSTSQSKNCGTFTTPLKTPLDRFFDAVGRINVDLRRASTDNVQHLAHDLAPQYVNYLHGLCDSVSMGTENTSPPTSPATRPQTSKPSLKSKRSGTVK